MVIKANNNISEHTQNIRFTVLGVMMHYTALALHSFSMNVQKPKKERECASARRTIEPNRKNPPEIELKNLLN